MKPISIDTKSAVALAAVLVSAACIVSAADDAIPLIRMVDVPLADAIRILARQSNLEDHATYSARITQKSDPNRRQP
jgi:hypothetical protein